MAPGAAAAVVAGAVDPTKHPELGGNPTVRGTNLKSADPACVELWGIFEQWWPEVSQRGYTLPQLRGGSPLRHRLVEFMTKHWDSGPSRACYKISQLRRQLRFFITERHPSLGPDHALAENSGQYLADLKSRLAAAGGRDGVASAAVSALLASDLCTNGCHFKLYREVVENLRPALEIASKFECDDLLSMIVSTRAKKVSQLLTQEAAFHAGRTARAATRAATWLAEARAYSPAGDTRLKDIVGDPTLAVGARIGAYAPEVRFAASLIATALSEEVYRALCTHLDNVKVLPVLRPPDGPDDGGSWGGGGPYPHHTFQATTVAYLSGWLVVKLKHDANGRRGNAGLFLEGPLMRLAQDWVLAAGSSSPPDGGSGGRVPTEKVARKSGTGRSGMASVFPSVTLYCAVSLWEKTMSYCLRHRHQYGHPSTLLKRTAEALLDDPGAVAIFQRTVAAIPDNATRSEGIRADADLVRSLMQRLLHHYVRMRGRDWADSIMAALPANSTKSVSFRGVVAVLNTQKATKKAKAKRTGEKIPKTADDASAVIEVEAVSESDSDGDTDADWDFDESLMDALMVRTAVEEAAEC